MFCVCARKPKPDHSFEEQYLFFGNIPTAQQIRESIAERLGLVPQGIIFMPPLATGGPIKEIIVEYSAPKLRTLSFSAPSAIQFSFCQDAPAKFAIAFLEKYVFFMDDHVHFTFDRSLRRTRVWDLAAGDPIVLTSGASHPLAVKFCCVSPLGGYSPTLSLQFPPTATVADAKARLARILSIDVGNLAMRHESSPGVELKDDASSTSSAIRHP
jgi:hypothetical protein